MSQTLPSASSPVWQQFLARWSPAVPDAVFAEARRLYDAFIVKLRPLLLLQQDKELGKFVMKPSDMNRVLQHNEEMARFILCASRGPMRDDASGKLLGLSVDDKGPISVETFERELQELEEQFAETHDRVQAAITECIQAFRELGAKHNLLATRLFDEINRRSLIEEQPKLKDNHEALQKELWCRVHVRAGPPDASSDAAAAGSDS